MTSSFAYRLARKSRCLLRLRFAVVLLWPAVSFAQGTADIRDPDNQVVTSVGGALSDGTTDTEPYSWPEKVDDASLKEAISRLDLINGPDAQRYAGDADDNSAG